MEPTFGRKSFVYHHLRETSGHLTQASLAASVETAKKVLRQILSPYPKLFGRQGGLCGWMAFGQGEGLYQAPPEKLPAAKPYRLKTSVFERNRLPLIVPKGAFWYTQGVRGAVSLPNTEAR
jgi:hypothetical protein